eukprot:12511696-Prorocentrum_lima.AAC.1
MRSGRPSIEYQHLTPTFAGTFVDASQIRLASLHPGRPPSRAKALEPPGPGAFLLKCASERRRR